jgi:hypothetical protein
MITSPRTDDDEQIEPLDQRRRRRDDGVTTLARRGRPPIEADDQPEHLRDEGDGPEPVPGRLRDDRAREKQARGDQIAQRVGHRAGAVRRIVQPRSEPQGDQHHAVRRVPQREPGGSPAGTSAMKAAITASAIICANVPSSART